MKLASWAVSAALLALATAVPTPDEPGEVTSTIAFRVSPDHKSCYLEYNHIGEHKEPLKSGTVGTYDPKHDICTNPNDASGHPKKASVPAGAEPADPKKPHANAEEGPNAVLFYRNATDPQQYRLWKVPTPQAGDLVYFPQTKFHLRGGIPKVIANFGHKVPIKKNVEEVHFKANSGARLIKNEWKPVEHIKPLAQ